MHVGVCRFTVLIAASHSLKEKRMVLRRVKDRVRERLGVTLAEVGGQDTWQRADLGFALATGERDAAQRGCEQVLRLVSGVDGAQITAQRIEVVGYGEEWFAEAAVAGEAWDAKAAGREDDLSWVPAGWLAPEED